jgi:hypothetical protein
MSLKLLLLVCVLTTAACREMTPTPIPTPSPAPTYTAAVQSDDDYIETVVSGVRLGMEVPTGWKAHKTQGGLLMTEFYDPSNMMGLLVHVFVFSTDDFNIPNGNDVNVALAVLNQVVLLPKYVQGGTVSDPQGFNWDNHDAAYYLLNNGDGSVGMLVAVAVETPQRLVVCNISSPWRSSQTIRVMLPYLLGNLSINGDTMDLRAVNELPNPLPFPSYQPKAEATPGGLP